MSISSEALAWFPAGDDARPAEGSAMHVRTVAWSEASVATGQLAARAIIYLAGDSSAYLCFHVRIRCDWVLFFQRAAISWLIFFIRPVTIRTLQDIIMCKKHKRKLS
jgi:hypothetical protein